MGYPTIESQRFGQEVVCRHDGRPFLEWRSGLKLLDEDGNCMAARHRGRLRRPVPEAEDGTNVELLLSHPTGFVEMYAGIAVPGRSSAHRRRHAQPRREGLHRRPPDLRERQQQPDVGHGHGGDGTSSPTQSAELVSVE